jgi:hypothetical protein
MSSQMIVKVILMIWMMLESCDLRTREICLLRQGHLFVSIDQYTLLLKMAMLNC